MICYEVGFDNLVRSEVTAGANLLAVQSNDADFEIDGQLGETEQQTAMARIRAIESDRAVVYASTTGESTIIAPDGALIAHSGVWQQAILDARVPLVSYRTLADRVGAWPEYVIIMLTVLALGWAVARSASGAAAGDSRTRNPRDVSGVCIGEGRIMSGTARRVAPRNMRGRTALRRLSLTRAQEEGHRAWHRPQVGRRARRFAAIAAAAAIGLLATACSSSGHAASPRLSPRLRPPRRPGRTRRRSRPT